MFIAHLCAEAVAGFVARTSVVHRNPGGARQAFAEHVASLVEEAVLPLDQQAHDLALGDQNAECLQQRYQSRCRHLPLMVLGEHEAAQFRSEMTMNAGRQRRCHHLAIRGLPTLAAEVHDV